MLFAVGALQGAFVCPPQKSPVHWTSNWRIFVGHFSGTTLNWPYDGRGKTERERIYSIWKGAQENNLIVQEFLRVRFICEPKSLWDFLKNSFHWEAIRADEIQPQRHQDVPS